MVSLYSGFTNSPIPAENKFDANKRVYGIGYADFSFTPTPWACAPETNQFDSFVSFRKLPPRKLSWGEKVAHFLAKFL